MTESLDLVQATIARLEAEVAELVSVRGALDFAELVKAGAVPHRTPAAFVLPLALDAEPNALLGGDHVQRLTETVGVVVVVRAAGAVAGGVLETGAPATSLVALRAAVRRALAGWQPDGAEAAFDFVSASLAGVAPGAAFLELAFALSWEV